MIASPKAAATSPRHDEAVAFAHAPKLWTIDAGYAAQFRGFQFDLSRDQMGCADEVLDIKVPLAFELASAVTLCQIKTNFTMLSLYNYILK
jgi:hypothetical protein